MIASSAALFAVLATLAAGQQFTVLPNAVTRDQAIAACANHGQQLAAITGATIEQVSALLPAGASGWIASWNTDTYGGACLQLKAGTITAAASCAEAHLPICQGQGHPEPSSSSSSSSSCEPIPESSSSSSCDFSSSSSSCDLSSESSWSEPSSCESSSSFSCSDSLSSDICSSSFTESSSSSSSSSSGKCDPCCAGVRKLTYQAPFGPGAYLAKVTQRYTVFDVFGPNACDKVATLSKALGVTAILVGSDGMNMCPPIVDGVPVPDLTPYGTEYVVSRAWALNQPIYALHNGIVSAANSLYNCYGEYRAIYISKPLSELTFVDNRHGDVCYERCKDKPRSCLALCNNELPRPNYLPKFKIGN